MGEAAAQGAARETLEEANAHVQALVPFSHLDIPVIGQAYLLFRQGSQHQSTHILYESLPLLSFLRGLATEVEFQKLHCEQSVASADFLHEQVQAPAQVLASALTAHS